MTRKILLLVIVHSLAFALIACAPPKPGEQGLPGATGSTGAQGPAGADGKEATVVQLCPGATVYPTVFVEVALCINNRLYAVYSANGGFLSEIVPGDYSSNAIGSACNLTVLPNCAVLQR